MKQAIWRSAMALGLVAALAGGVYAQGGRKAEKHPVLQNSIRQLGVIKDRLQKAPTDFGGHKEKAVDAINHAIDELNQAIAFDKK